MSQRIRMRVWLLGLSPFAAVAVVLALVFMQRGAPRATRPVAAGSAEAVEPTAPPTPTVMPLPVPTVAPTPSPAQPAPAVSVAATASSESLKAEALVLGPAGDPPEPIPELDALLRPPPQGSQRWTPEEKEAYRRKLFDDLDARERTLERELAAAKRSGDKATADRKSATLSYLRAKRDALQRLAQQVAERDSGS